MSFHQEVICLEVMYSQRVQHSKASYGQGIVHQLSSLLRFLKITLNNFCLCLSVLFFDMITFFLFNLKYFMRLFSLVPDNIILFDLLKNVCRPTHRPLTSLTES